MHLITPYEKKASGGLTNEETALAQKKPKNLRKSNCG